MLRRIVAALLVIAGSAWPTQGADYPDAPVTLIIPFPQGGSTGFTAKVLADELQKIWRQPVYLPTDHTASTALPPRGEFVIRNGFVLTMDATLRDIPRGSVHVRNGEIPAPPWA